ncbi:hypothetical protein EBZ37_14090, partial [bacterium]|nr:hypothetical protein [bacterium]
LLDVPALVEQYKTSRKDFVSSGRSEKQASARSLDIAPAQTSWPTAATFARPSLFSDIKKQASSEKSKMQESPQKEEMQLGKLMELLRMTKRAAEEVEQVVFEVVPEIESKMRGMLRKYSSGNVFSEVCEDMNLLDVQAVRPALDLLAYQFQKQASGVKYWDGTATRYLVSDRHKAQSELVELSGLIRSLGEAQETAAELRKQSAELEDIVFSKEASPQPNQPPSRKGRRNSTNWFGRPCWG